MARQYHWFMGQAGGFEETLTNHLEPIAYVAEGWTLSRTIIWAQFVNKATLTLSSYPFVPVSWSVIPKQGPTSSPPDDMWIDIDQEFILTENMYWSYHPYGSPLNGSVNLAPDIVNPAESQAQRLAGSTGLSIWWNWSMDPAIAGYRPWFFWQMYYRLLFLDAG